MNLYDGEGNRRVRAGQSGSSISLVYHYTDPVSSIPNIIADTDASYTITTRYEYGLDLERMKNIGASSYYYHTDALGSVRKLTDVNQNITDSYLYDAFGNTLSSSGSSGNAYKFTGERYDGSAGLLYLRARYYDPEIGRFMSRDPIEDVNLYVYVENNPVNKVDPKGLQPECERFGHNPSAVNCQDCCDAMCRLDFAGIVHCQEICYSICDVCFGWPAIKNELQRRTKPPWTKPPSQKCP